MKMAIKVNCVVVGKTKGDYQGKPTYRISIAQDGEAGSIKCSMAVFDEVQLYKPYELDCTFNDQYNSVTANTVISGDKK